MKLYVGSRSPASLMVQLVLAAKDIEHDVIKVSDVEDKSSFPDDMHDLPALLHGGLCVTQPLAIIEFLDEQVGSCALYPEDPYLRAAVRSFVQVISGELLSWELGHFSRWLEQREGVNETDQKEGLLFCLQEGFSRLEYRLAHQSRTGTYCFGETLTLADYALLPQVVFARRAGLDMGAFPHIDRICDNCLELSWCRAVLD